VRKELSSKIEAAAGSLRKTREFSSDLKPEEVSVGDTVQLLSHGVKAIVLKEPKDGNVYVQAGALN